MSMVSPVHAPAPVHAPLETRNDRAPVDYGGAVGHRDMVREKLRVDPAALADRKRASENVRARDPPPPDDDKGRYVDISA